MRDVKLEIEPAAQLYQVRQGDTLSDLAQRFLGSSARYAEIFEANRNILRNPNDLQVGMRIHIPRRPETAASPAVRVRPISSGRGIEAGASSTMRESSRAGAPARGATSETRSGPADSRKAKKAAPEPRPPEPRFVPAYRAPFTPRRYTIRSSSEGDGPASPRRKFSQIPPGEQP